MRQSVVGDFFIGLLGAWAVGAVLAAIGAVIRTGMFWGLASLAAWLGIAIASMRAQRPYIALGVVAAVVVAPVLLIGVACALMSTGAWKIS